jgi:large subunit ribosomal protein L25
LQINEGIHLKDIPKTEGLRFLDDPEHMVVSVAAPMTDAKLESLLTTGAPGAEAAKEPEVAVKGKGVAEGAAGADAGKAGDAKAGAAAPKAGAAPAKKEPEKKK